MSEELTPLEIARYGKHSVFNSLARANVEGQIAFVGCKLWKQIIDTKRYVRAKAEATA